MRITELFNGPGPIRDALKWSSVCFLVGGVIAIGYQVGWLQLAVNTVIAAFALIQGVIPFCKSVISLHVDRRRNHRAVLELREVKGSVLDALLKEDLTNAGSVYQCLGTIKALEGRVSSEVAIDRSMEVAKKGWYMMLQPTKTASDLCPNVGLGGSIAGLVGMLSAGASDEEIQTSFMTMFTSTGIGCAASFVLSGFVDIGQGWIDRHVDDVKLVVNQLITGDRPEDDQLDDDSYL